MGTIVEERKDVDEAEDVSGSAATPCYAVFVLPQKAVRSVDPPCLDALDFGEGKEPAHDELLRRGRVGLFRSRDDAMEAIRHTGEANRGQPFLREFAFLVMECRDRRDALHDEIVNDDPIYDIRVAVAEALRSLDVRTASHKEITDCVVDHLPDFFRQTLRAYAGRVSA